MGYERKKIRNKLIGRRSFEIICNTGSCHQAPYSSNQDMQQMKNHRLPERLMTWDPPGRRGRDLPRITEQNNAHGKRENSKNMNFGHMNADVTRKLGLAISKCNNSK